MMIYRFPVWIYLFTALCLGQALPDREELVTRFLNDATSAEAAGELIEHFRMGGVRTIIRNLNNIPYQRALAYGEALRYLDLSRFANDLNNNLGTARGPQTRALYLMLLATAGRKVGSSVFEGHMADDSAPLYVRLAAGSGLVKIQSASNYDRFLALADRVVIDPAAGLDDLAFADLSQENTGFFLYTKGKLEDNRVSHGAVVSALAMAEANDTDIFEMILMAKKKKYIPLMIDRAIRVGGVALLKTMATHKTAKKSRDIINLAMATAREVASYRARFPDKLSPALLKLGPAVRPRGAGSGSRQLPAAYAVARVAASGEMSVVAYHAPFGGDDALRAMLSGITFPAFNTSWEAVESFVLVRAP